MKVTKTRTDYLYFQEFNQIKIIDVASEDFNNKLLTHIETAVKFELYGDEYEDMRNIIREYLKTDPVTYKKGFVLTKYFNGVFYDDKDIIHVIVSKFQDKIIIYNLTEFIKYQMGMPPYGIAR